MGSGESCEGIQFVMNDGVVMIDDGGKKAREGGNYEVLTPTAW